jgi:hypothetical protein
MANHADNLVTIQVRDPLDRSSQGIMAIFRSIAKNIFPYLDNENVADDDTAVPTDIGLTTETTHYSFNRGFNVKAGSSARPTKVKHDIYLWSSYRYVFKHKNASPDDIAMFATMRTFYGTNVTLSRSKNPSLLIPH